MNAKEAEKLADQALLEQEQISLARILDNIKYEANRGYKSLSSLNEPHYSKDVYILLSRKNYDYLIELGYRIEVPAQDSIDPNWSLLTNYTIRWD